MKFVKEAFIDVSKSTNDLEKVRVKTFQKVIYKLNRNLNNKLWN